jgi:hypothetical protein
VVAAKADTDAAIRQRAESDAALVAAKADTDAARLSGDVGQAVVMVLGIYGGILAYHAGADRQKAKQKLQSTSPTVDARVARRAARAARKSVGSILGQVRWPWQSMLM